MRQLRKRVLPFLALLLVPALAGAQDVKIPKGTYAIVPDSTFSADFDVTGIVSEVTETTMTTTQAGAILVKSNLSFAGDVVSFTDVEGQFMCPGVAKYKVMLNAKGFRIVAIDDPCVERAGVLNQVAFVRTT
jgi:hypothetical protein